MFMHALSVVPFCIYWLMHQSGARAICSLIIDMTCRLPTINQWTSPLINCFLSSSGCNNSCKRQIFGGQWNISIHQTKPPDRLQISTLFRVTPLCSAKMYSRQRTWWVRNPIFETHISLWICLAILASPWIHRLDCTSCSIDAVVSRTSPVCFLMAHMDGRMVQLDSACSLNVT